MMQPLLQAIGLSKHYPGVVALDGVDFTLRQGEVHVLFGENGAGKSTLISLLAGVNSPTAGTLHRDGKPVQFHSVRDARAAGISAVFQEFSLVPTLSVAENMFLGDEPRRGRFIDRGAMVRRATELLADLEFAIPPTALVASLSRAEQQMVEIAKAFRGDLSVLILDEPTASLSDKETDHLFATILRLKQRGIGIVYISHRIHEFARIADRITVLRDGKLCATVPATDADEARLLELMAGRAIGDVYPTIAHRPGQDRLVVRNLVAPGVDGVSFTIRAGEVLGFAGLVGSGKSEVWRALTGLGPRQGGDIRLGERDLSNRPARDLLRQGLFYLPPDRKHDGLQLTASSEQNLILGLLDQPTIRNRFGLLSWRAARQQAAQIARRVDLSPAYHTRLVSQLSGGNQQKVLFGKGFGRDFDVYVLDEPTVGVDMGTRAQLYRLIQSLVEAGKAVVVVSSDLPEVMNLAHRLLVFAHGHITAELTGDAITETNVLRHFFSQERMSA